MTVPRSPRAHDAVLGQPILEALLPEVVRAEQRFEAMADGVEGAMAHEGRAQQRAKNKIVAERVEALGILERGSLRGRSLPWSLHHLSLELKLTAGFGGQLGAAWRMSPAASTAHCGWTTGGACVATSRSGAAPTS